MSPRPPSHDPEPSPLSRTAGLCRPGLLLGTHLSSETRLLLSSGCGVDSREGGWRQGQKTFLFLPPHVLQRKEWPRVLEELFLHPIILLSETFPGRLTVQNRLISTEGPRLSPAPVYGDKPNQKGFLGDPEGCMATRGLSGPHSEVVGRACLNLGLCTHQGPRVECLGFHMHTLYRWLET